MHMSGGGGRALFHSKFMYFGLSPLHAGCINKASYLSTGPKPDYSPFIEMFSVCIFRVVLVVAMVLLCLNANDPYSGEQRLADIILAQNMKSHVCVIYNNEWLNCYLKRSSQY